MRRSKDEAAQRGTCISRTSVRLTRDHQPAGPSPSSGDCRVGMGEIPEVWNWRLPDYAR